MPGVQSLGIPLLGVSCGLLNPFHFYPYWVERAVRAFPHTAGYCPTSYLVGRQPLTTLGSLSLCRHRGWTISSHPF